MTVSQDKDIVTRLLAQDPELLLAAATPETEVGLLPGEEGDPSTSKRFLGVYGDGKGGVSDDTSRRRVSKT